MGNGVVRLLYHYFKLWLKEKAAPTEKCIKWRRGTYTITKIFNSEPCWGFYYMQHSFSGILRYIQ